MATLLQKIKSAVNPVNKEHDGESQQARAPRGFACPTRPALSLLLTYESPVRLFLLTGASDRGRSYTPSKPSSLNPEYADQPRSQSRGRDTGVTPTGRGEPAYPQPLAPSRLEAAADS